MAVKAALVAVLAFSTLAIAAALSHCISSEPHVDCNFHSMVSSSWDDLSAQSDELSAAWRSVAAQVSAYPAERFSGRGLVITATKLDMVNVPVLLKTLQSEGFNLPVEIWYSGEVSTEVMDTLSSTYDKLVIKNVANYASAEDLKATVTSQGKHVFQAKPIAILNSAFEEVLFMDADNIAMSNPAALFDSAEYKKTGALFWPDFWQTATENPVWSILNLKPQGIEQESGQIVVNKKNAWKALNLAFFFAKDATFQKLINGDKEAFRLAFLATETPFFMVETPVASAGAQTEAGSFCGHTMVQHDLLGESLFLHHNSLKHGVAISWDLLKSVAAGKSFSVVPLPSATFNGDAVSCLDLVGADVTSSPAPFTAFEEVYSGFQATTAASLKDMSKTEFVTVQFETMRRLLQDNGTLSVPADPLTNTCEPGAFQNACFAANGLSAVCCSTSCSTSYAADGTQLCVGEVPAPAPADVIDAITLVGPAPGQGTCPPDFQNQCFAPNGLSSVCCATGAAACGTPVDDATPTCAPL